MFAGLGSRCADVPPPCPPTGSCCNPSLQCQDGWTAATCANTYAGDGTTCAASPCTAVTGACCGAGQCSDFFARSDCERSPGHVFLGIGTDCALPGACAAVTGACCAPGLGCRDGYAAPTCAAGLGLTSSYAGTGTSCMDVPAPCETGACCVAPGDCRELLTRHECTDLGGTFTPGRLCSAAGC